MNRHERRAAAKRTKLTGQEAREIDIVAVMFCAGVRGLVPLVGAYRELAPEGPYYILYSWECRLCCEWDEAFRLRAPEELEARTSPLASTTPADRPVGESMFCSHCEAEAAAMGHVAMTYEIDLERFARVLHPLAILMQLDEWKREFSEARK